jgi:hypothetical protein
MTTVSQDPHGYTACDHSGERAIAIGRLSSRARHCVALLKSLGFLQNGLHPVCSSSTIRDLAAHWVHYTAVAVLSSQEHVGFWSPVGWLQMIRRVWRMLVLTPDSRDQQHNDEMVCAVDLVWQLDPQSRASPITLR